jgi:hypothetical protein
MNEPDGAVFRDNRLNLRQQELEAEIAAGIYLYFIYI